MGFTCEASKQSWCTNPEIFRLIPGTNSLLASILFRFPVLVLAYIFFICHNLHFMGQIFSLRGNKLACTSDIKILGNDLIVKWNGWCNHCKDRLMTHYELDRFLERYLGKLEHFHSWTKNLAFVIDGYQLLRRLGKFNRNWSRFVSCSLLHQNLVSHFWC